jgi:hypothetical protein
MNKLTTATARTKRIIGSDFIFYLGEVGVMNRKTEMGRLLYTRPSHFTHFGLHAVKRSRIPFFSSDRFSPSFG